MLAARPTSRDTADLAPETGSPQVRHEQAAQARTPAGAHAIAAPAVCRPNYLAGPRADAQHVKLTGTPQPAPWDPELSQVMAAAGRVLFEENMGDALVQDLSSA
jgi:hypothetical protein